MKAKRLPKVRYWFIWLQCDVNHAWYGSLAAYAGNGNYATLSGRLLTWATWHSVNEWHEAGYELGGRISVEICARLPRRPAPSPTKSKPKAKKGAKKR